MSTISEHSKAQAMTLISPQLLNRLASHKGLARDLGYLSTLPEPTNTISMKLPVGSYTASPGKRSDLWAYVRSQACSSSDEIRNQVTYYLDDDLEYKPAAMNDLELVEPFKHIQGPDQAIAKDKVRVLVLFYFLKANYLDAVRFRARAFEGFRVVCANVAKAEVKKR
jgi:hypothetical protein